MQKVLVVNVNVAGGGALDRIGYETFHIAEIDDHLGMGWEIENVNSVGVGDAHACLTFTLKKADDPGTTPLPIVGGSRRSDRHHY